MRRWLYDGRWWDEAKVMDDVGFFLRQMEESRPPEPRLLSQMRAYWVDNARAIQTPTLFDEVTR